MKKLPVFIKVKNEKIICMCLRSRRRCGAKCEKDIVFYDEYAGINECFYGNKEVLWNTAKSSTTARNGKESKR